MKRFAIVYLSTLVILLPLNFLFLGTIGKTLFEKNVNDMILATPRMAPAILFYLIYLSGIVVFVNRTASNWTSNLGYGALFGLFCYATFELTNMTVLKHWEWVVVVADIAWGAVLTGISASVGGALAQGILGKVS